MIGAKRFYRSCIPRGLWPTEIHDAIIDEAFKCLDSISRQKLKDASGYVDGVLNGGAWMEEYAYQHGMRAPDETVDHARHAANEFIEKHVKRAKNSAPRLQVRRQ